MAARAVAVLALVACAAAAKSGSCSALKAAYKGSSCCSSNGMGNLTRQELTGLIKATVAELMAREPCHPTVDESKFLTEIYFNISGTKSIWGLGWAVQADAGSTSYFSRGRGNLSTVGIRKAGCASDPGVPEQYRSPLITTGEFRPMITLLYRLGNGCHVRSEGTGLGGQSMFLQSYAVDPTCESDEYDWLNDVAVFAKYNFEWVPEGNDMVGVGTARVYEFADGESMDDCLPLPMGYTGLQVLGPGGKFV